MFPIREWGFDSPLGHHSTHLSTRSTVWRANGGELLKTALSCETPAASSASGRNTGFGTKDFGPKELGDTP